MKIFVPLFSGAVVKKVFPAAGVNPGCGGTQHVTVLLAWRLALVRPEWEVVFGTEGEVRLEQVPANLRTEVCSNPEEFYDGLGKRIAAGEKLVVVGVAAELGKVTPDRLVPIADRTVAYIHHPLSWKKELRALNFPAHVFTGVYQWHSNAMYYPRSWYIQNILPRASGERGREHRSDSAQPSTAPWPRLVHLGALIPGKKFLLIAQQWRRIREIFSEARLEVIGGSATYGQESSHPLIPCEDSYAEAILQEIPREDIEKGRVIFHGNLGPEKVEVLRGAHAALQNPTGATEAFPASPLECMAEGVPVIASDDFGMGDAMRFFPELTLRSPSEIPSKLQLLLSDSRRWQQFSERSRAVARFFADRSDESVWRWVELIERVAAGEKETLGVRPPTLSFHGSRTKLRYRFFRKRVGLLRQSLRRA